MIELEKRVAGLRNYFPLTEANVEAFLEEVASITATGDRRTVKPLLLLTDEQCPLGGVMDRMLSLLENIPLNEYVAELLEALPEFSARSPLYSEQEVKKLLWSNQDRSTLTSAARRLTGQEAASLRAVLDRVGAPSLAAAVQEVREAIGIDVS